MDGVAEVGEVVISDKIYVEGWANGSAEGYLCDSIRFSADRLSGEVLFTQAVDIPSAAMISRVYL